MAGGPKVIDTGDAAVRKIWAAKVSAHAIWKSIFLNPSWGFYGKEEDSRMICEAPANEAGITATLTMTGQMTGDGTVDGAPVAGLGGSFPHWNFSFDIHELTSEVFEEKSQYEDQKVEFDIAARGRRANVEWWNVPFNTAFPIQGTGYTCSTTFTNYKPAGRSVVGSGAGNQYAGMNAVDSANLVGRIKRPSAIANDESLTTSHTFGVDIIDEMAAELSQLEFPFRDVRWAGGESLLWFIHTDQLYDLQRDSHFKNMEDSILQGGGDYADSTYARNAARPYKGFTFVVSNWMPPGVHSTTGAPVADTRRSMICGAGAFAMRFGIGHSVNRLKTSMGKSNKGGSYWCVTRCTFGVKRIDYNSKAYATYVVPTYAKNRGDAL